MTGRRAWLAHCSRIGALAAAAAAVALTGRRRQPTAPLILVVGDSLSAEYGLARGTGWVALLEQRLAREKIAARVVNASISGDTTSGGRSRLPALLAQHKPTHVILELGGNDALRGLPLTMTQDNLAQMARAAKAAGARVLIAGMQVPPNYGRKYAEDFAALFAARGQDRRRGAGALPAQGRGRRRRQRREMFQADRIHPNAAAHPLMLGNVWPVLLPLLRGSSK